MMVETNLKRIFMHIHLNDDDFSQMPNELRTQFLHWLPKYLKNKNSQSNLISVRQQCQAETPPTQLILNLESQTTEDKADYSQVRLTQLFDAGITKRGMAIRVKLKHRVAKQLGLDYINSLEISAKGTIVYNGQEFDKPSPLATKVNGSSANGREYIEVKRNNQWVCLGGLREIWRKSND